MVYGIISTAVHVAAGALLGHLAGGTIGLLVGAIYLALHLVFGH